MNSKKTIAGIFALSTLMSSGAFTAMNAFEADSADYKTGKITVHMYSDENLKDIEGYEGPCKKEYNYYSEWIKHWFIEVNNITEKADKENASDEETAVREFLDFYNVNNGQS